MVVESQKLIDWAKSFAGCDGGDMGSPSSPSVWVCGEEPGGGFNMENFDAEKVFTPCEEPPPGVDVDDKEWQSQPFTISVLKVIQAMEGFTKHDDFMRQVKPFVHDAKTGFFKMNLLPLSLRHHNEQYWSPKFKEITEWDWDGYLKFCRENRFHAIKNWVQKYQPQLVICFGKDLADDFKAAFAESDTEFKSQPYNENTERQFSWGKNNKSGTVIAICHFPSGPNGLHSNALLEGLGRRLKEIMAEYI